MVTVCVYYGENASDGPMTLTDMRNILQNLCSVANDYKMNLIQVRDSERFHLKNPDVQAVFEDGMLPKEIAHKMHLTVKQIKQVLEECKANADI